MKNINIRIVLTQFLSLVFLIYGIKMLYIYSQAEKYKCILESFHNSKCKCLEKYKSPFENIGDFINREAYFVFLTLIIGILLVFLFNRKYKINFFNSILVFLITFLLLGIGMFRKGIVNQLFNSFGELFTKEFEIKYFIGGITFTIIGFFVLWKSKKLK